MRLYHYCSMSTFGAMITEGKIRLSDISKSNDSLELKYMADILKAVFPKAYQAEKTQYFRKSVGADTFEEAIGGWLNKLENDLPTCYAICFSQRPDQLSQWRGYANDAKGVSIGFEKDSIFRSAKGQGLKLDKVIYDQQIQKAMARTIADSIIRELKAMVKAGGSISRDEILSVIEAHRAELVRLLVICKSGFFKEEEEWRLYCCDRDTAYEVHYFLSESDCKRYIEMELRHLAPTIDTVDIRLGPKNRALPDDVKAFVNVNGINSTVTRSKGTYR